MKVAHRIITPPTDEPLTIDECRQHLNVTPYEFDSDNVGSHPDDDLIMQLQGAAREHCEAFVGLSYTRRIIEAAVDAFPTQRVDGSTAIELPMGPVIEVTGVDVGADPLDAAAWQLDDFRSPMRLLPTVEWPPVTESLNVVRIRYLAGYGVDSAGDLPLPKALRAALLLVLGHLYANREDSVEKALSSLPLGAEALMRPLRVVLGFA